MQNFFYYFYPFLNAESIDLAGLQNGPRTEHQYYLTKIWYVSTEYKLKLISKAGFWEFCKKNLKRNIL